MAWFAAIMLLGNMAMSTYVLVQLPEYPREELAAPQNL
jgi:hypothetical protein